MGSTIWGPSTLRDCLEGRSALVFSALSRVERMGIEGDGFGEKFGEKFGEEFGEEQ